MSEMWGLRAESKYAGRIMEFTFKEKANECSDILNFFKRLCVMGDIGFDIHRVEGPKLPYYVCQFTLRTYLELQTDLFVGAYHSVGRSLRWLYELNIAGSTAVIFPSLLSNEYEGKDNMGLKEFEDWLENYDNRKGSINRSKIFSHFGLPAKDLQLLYSRLCKYSHVSSLSFDKERDWPKLQFLPKKFDEIFKVTTEVMDLVLWFESKMLLCYNKGTKKALKGFLEDTDDLNKYIPITISLLSSLS